MIRWLDELPQQYGLWSMMEAACPAEAAMIWAEAPMLGVGEAGLWMQEGEDCPTALLLRNPMGGVVLAALPQCNADELAEFLQVVGYGSLTLPQMLAEKITLPNTAAQQYRVMQWAEEQAAMPLGYRLCPIETEKLLQNTVEAFGETLTQEEQAEWKWAFELRRRRGTAEAYGLYRRQEMLAAAALSHIGRKAAIVGFVGTPPALRGQGSGMGLAAALAAHAKERGLQPLLCCKNELEESYRKFGFETIAEQTVIRPL